MYHSDYTEASSSVISIHLHHCATIINIHFPSSVSKESACSAGDQVSIPGWERSPGERNGNSLQYSRLENPMDRGAWQDTVHGVTVHGVAKSWT